jgi:hypothetical protein
MYTTGDKRVYAGKQIFLNRSEEEPRSDRDASVPDSAGKRYCTLPVGNGSRRRIALGCNGEMGREVKRKRLTFG